MRYIITSLLLLFSVLTFGQKKDKFSIVLQAQPELTFHKNDYAHRYKEKYTKTTINVAVSSSIQYCLTDNLFLSAGLGFIPRQLKTNVFLNQGAIPPPRQSGTQELVTTRSVSYRTLFLPVNLGYIFLNKNKLSSFGLCEFSGNYVLNVKYDVNFDKYDGTYQKNYWQGYSLNVGIGSEYKISKKMYVNSSISYSLINTVHQDKFLFSQDEYQIPLPHKYLTLSIGVKTPL